MEFFADGLLLHSPLTLERENKREDRGGKVLMDRCSLAESRFFVEKAVDFLCTQQQVVLSLNLIPRVFHQHVLLFMFFLFAYLKCSERFKIVDQIEYDIIQCCKMTSQNYRTNNLLDLCVRCSTFIHCVSLW